jgi:hypothetical protein
LRHACQHLDALGPIRRRDPSDFLKALGAVADVIGVDSSVADEQVQEAIGERRIRTRPKA